MKKSRKALFAIIAFILTLVLVEIGLRVYFRYAGYQVGSLAPGWQPVRQVDSLAVSHSYYTDNKGVFRADSSFWGGKGVVIDKNGFRKMPAVRNDTLLPNLLLLGDSYTWGAGATKLENSFADILASDKKYTLYNTGIPGADPAQYALIADSFIPKLRPTLTAVMLYMGNDLMDEQRQPAPYQPLYYVTNTGWLPGYYHGHYFPSADSSYQYYLHLYTPETSFGKLAVRTAIGTLLLSLPLRLQERAVWKQRQQLAITHSYLLHIAAICKQYRCKLMVFIIPYSGTDLGTLYTNEPKQYLLKKYPHTFTGLEDAIYPLPMEKQDYLPLPDGHFNDDGHAKAAHYMRSVLGSL